MSDSSLKTILGVAAVGAAGVGAYYLLKKKDQIIQPVITVIDTIRETNDGINETIKDITSSNRPNSTKIVEEGLENAGITNAPELLKYNLLPGNVTAANVGLNIFSDAIANAVQGAINSITGSAPAASETPISKYAYTDESRNTILEEDPREAAQPVPTITTKTEVKDDAKQIATVTSNPTPITENGTQTVGQQITAAIKSITAAADKTRSERISNVGAGKTVTGIQSNNKFVGEILKKYGFNVTSESYV